MTVLGSFLQYGNNKYNQSRPVSLALPQGLCACSSLSRTLFCPDLSCCSSSSQLDFSSLPFSPPPPHEVRPSRGGSVLPGDSQSCHPVLSCEILVRCPLLHHQFPEVRAFVSVSFILSARRDPSWHVVGPVNTRGASKWKVYSVPGTVPSTSPRTLHSKTPEMRSDWLAGTLLYGGGAGISVWSLIQEPR